MAGSRIESELIYFINESTFTGELLCDGLTALGKVQFPSKSELFHAFTSLSLGLERLGKMIIIIDYLIENGTLPQAGYLKCIGHNLEKISKRVILLKRKYDFNLNYLQDLDSSIHQEIIRELSDFGTGDRYSNLNTLLGQPTQDPIQRWYKNVESQIYKTKISRRKRLQIEEKSRLLAEMMDPNSMTAFVSIDNQIDNSLEKLLIMQLASESIRPFRQLYVFQVVRLFVEILCKIQAKYCERSQDDIDITLPYFSEIFVVFNNEDGYIKLRRSWKLQ